MIKFRMENKSVLTKFSNQDNQSISNEVLIKENKTFFESLSTNPYFSAGFALVGVGALITILKQGTALGYTIVQKNLTISLEVVSKDKSYDWILKWINMNLKKRAQHINVETFFERNDKSQRIATSFSFTPSIGIHYFNYKNHWIRAERVREQVVDRNTGSPVETLKLTTLGRDIEIFKSILSESRKIALNEQTGKTLIYNARTGKRV
jgi:mitochondrial chaperone BCS1